MKKRIRFIIPIILIAASVMGFFAIRDNEGPGNLQLSGNIDVTQVPLAFKIPGILAERLADEGETVKKGQIIARLDAVDQRLQVKKAEAEAAYARAVLDELEAGSRLEEVQSAAARLKQARYLLEELERGSRSQEVADAESALQRALASEDSRKSEYELASSDYRRYEAVYKEGGISRQSLDVWKTRMETAKNRFEEAVAMVQSVRERLSLVKEGPRKEKISQARAAYQQAEAQYRLIKAGPRAESISQAKARVASAEQAVELARQLLANTEIAAPFDGVVLSKSAEPGAYLYPGTPVVTVAEMGRVWLRAYIGETDLGKIKLNQEAVVTTDTYPGKSYQGRVSFISSQAEFTPKAVQTFEERVNLMYRVKIDLQNPDGDLKPGMPADARIRITP